jgi:TRAP transporter 4TM/12TM fusion protein
MSDVKVEGRAIGNRDLGRITRAAVRWFAVAFALFHIATSGFGNLPNLVQRSIHVGGAMILALLVYSWRSRGGGRPGLFDFAGIVVAAVTPIWLALNYDRFMLGVTGPSTVDIVLAVLFILFLLETARRVIGLPFVLIAAFFIFYAYLGNWLPYPLKSAGLSLTTMIESLFMTTDGLWGVTTAVTANVVGIYIVMGEILLVTGGGQIFVDLASRITGRSVGGPAKVAVISSSLFGMLSGAPAANAAVTGNFTIHLMKRRGYTGEFAAAVEAVASSGSQIMPPVMGAAAFIMAEFLGIPYSAVITAALVPALLFYATVLFGVHLHGQRHGLVGAASDVPPADARWWLRVATSFALPIGILLVILFRGYTTSMAAFWAIVAGVAVYLLEDLRPAGIRKRVARVVTGLERGGYALILIGLLAGAAQIVVGLIGLTGFGVKLSSFIISVSAGNFVAALVLAALVAMVLGMGMPTTAVYILSASVVAPALVDFGVLPIAAHLFLFYYGLLAAITPPVCVAVFVTAGIAQADWLRTAWESMKLGLAKFVVPFIFVYHYELLLIGSWPRILLALLTGLLGTYALSAGSTRYLNGDLRYWEAGVALVAAVLLIMPDFLPTSVGFVLFALLWLYRRTVGGKPLWRAGAENAA